MQLRLSSRINNPVGSGLAFSLMILLVALSFFQMHYVGGSGEADFLWNASEGYLFVHGGRQGYRMSYLGYLAEMIKEPLGLTPPADDKNSFTLIFLITPRGVERHETTSTFEFYTPVDNAIYAGHQGSLWKWAGTQFEPATSEEYRKLDGTARLSRRDFSDVNGWSARYSVTSRRFNEIEAEIKGKPVALSVKTLNAVDGEVSIDLTSPGRPPETIYHMSFNPRRVSRTEYEKTFSTN